MLELDSLLVGFVENGYSDLSPAERERFEQLLALPDPLLWAWLFGGTQPDDPGMASLVERVRATDLVSN